MFLMKTYLEIMLSQKAVCNKTSDDVCSPQGPVYIFTGVVKHFTGRVGGGYYKGLQREGVAVSREIPEVRNFNSAPGDKTGTD